MRAAVALAGLALLAGAVDAYVVDGALWEAGLVGLAAQGLGGREGGARRLVRRRQLRGFSAVAVRRPAGDAGGNTFIFLAKFAFGYDRAWEGVGD